MLSQQYILIASVLPYKKINVKIINSECNQPKVRWIIFVRYNLDHVLAGAIFWREDRCYTIGEMGFQVAQ